ncbi:hypothetical protein KXD40_007823 [Peronospora effusa]|uniref:RxLR effector protein n=1 Tax=Peronospora effusa TaxID=542832 RepID=A0A3M6VC09_9STRA|nr:hypothetical protein DD238_007884 [Peronospora effusa]RQM10279.1 hypothetical protein DD237_007939 [Peronospora effusa]UIZ23464.1 hypothetical protein KXD40_007823 [Peronospora effusa]
MNVNVLVKEDLAEAKKASNAAGNPTKLSQELYYTGGRDDGERGVIGEGLRKVVEKVKNVVAPNQDNLAAKAATLQLDPYETFLKAIGELSEEKAIVELTNKLDGRIVAQLIVRAKTDAIHKDAALKLEKAQMQYWLKQNKSGQDVFKLLELSNSKDLRVDDLLARPLFDYWSTYVKIFNKENSKGKIWSVFDILMSEYKHSDITLARLIVAAKKKSTPTDAVLELEEAQMKYWLDSAISADELLLLLGLTSAKDDLLAHPLFGYWMIYVGKLDTNALKKEGVVDFFKTEFKYSDGDLARLIIHAKMGPQLEGAKKLEEAQMEYLLRTVTSGILTHPLFNYWYTYFERINVEYNKNNKVIEFLMEKAPDKRIDPEVFLKDEVEKAKFVKRSDVDDLFMELRLDKVTNGLFTNELFIFWRTCLEKFEAAHPEEPRTSVFHLLRTVYDDKGLASLLKAERQIEKSNNFAKTLEKKLCGTWVKDGKSLDDVFELLDLKAAGYKLLDDPSMDTFVTFTHVVNDIKKTHTGTKEAAFEENEILRGIKFASSTGGLRSTKSENALFQLWFTQKRSPNEIFMMFFGKDNLDKILKDEGNLFEIPLFITFMKYADAYPRTKRLATDEEYEKVVTDIERRPWKTDPATMVDYVDRNTNVAFMLQGQFKDKLETLGEMILSAKKLKESKPAVYAAQRVEDEMFRFWNINRGVTPDYLFEALKLDAEMTPEKLFEIPLFGWWIDYMDVFLRQIKPTDHAGETLMKVFKSPINLVWLKYARKTEGTRELANKVWKELLKQHEYNDTSPEKVKQNQMLLSYGDDKLVFEDYTKTYTKRGNDVKKEKEVKGRIEEAEEEKRMREAE